MPRKDRKAYNEYMKKYLPNYRKSEHELVKKYKRLAGIPEDKRRKKKQ